MTSLLLATRNKHKTREFAQLLGSDFTISDLTTEPDLPEITETGSTFQENATLKAVAVSQQRPAQIVIADDSGLEVDALEGKPGIFSARYAGEDASDRQNVQKLLRELRSLGQPTRSARFRCVIALARGGELLATVTGEAHGTIADAPRGKNGFGYDPIFTAKGYDRTFAELTAEVKNQISHRARATHRLRELFAIDAG